MPMPPALGTSLPLTGGAWGTKGMGGDETEEAAGATSRQAVKEPIRAVPRTGLLTAWVGDCPRDGGPMGE